MTRSRLVPNPESACPYERAGVYDVDAGMREWDRLTSQRVRARGD